MAKLLAIYRRSPGEARILRETFFYRTLDSVVGAARGVSVLYDRPGRETRYMTSVEPPPPMEAEEEE